MVNICVFMGRISKEPRAVIIPQKDDNGVEFNMEYVYIDIELSEHYYNEIQQTSRKDIHIITVRFNNPKQIGIAKRFRVGHPLHVISKVRTYNKCDVNQIWQKEHVFDVGLYRFFDDFRHLSKTASTFDRTTRGMLIECIEDALGKKDWSIVKSCLSILKNITEDNGGF